MAVNGVERGETAASRCCGSDATAAGVVDVVNHGDSSDDAVPGVLPTAHGGDSGLPQICCSSADRSRMRSSHERPKSVLLLLPLERV